MTYITRQDVQNWPCDCRNPEAHHGTLPAARLGPAAWHTMNELLPLVLWLGLTLAIGAASTGAVAFVLTRNRRSLPCGAADREITSRACPVRP